MFAKNCTINKGTGRASAKKLFGFFDMVAFSEGYVVDDAGFEPATPAM